MDYQSKIRLFQSTYNNVVHELNSTGVDNGKVNTSAITRARVELSKLTKLAKELRVSLNELRLKEKARRAAEKAK